MEQGTIMQESCKDRDREARGDRTRAAPTLSAAGRRPARARGALRTAPSGGSAQPPVARAQYGRRRAWAAAAGFLGLLVLSGAVPAGVEAQVPVEFRPGSSVLTRADLEDLLRQYEEALASPAYSGRVKDAVRKSAARVRQRLEEGDFRVGDRVVLSVQGEPSLPDTVPVEPGPQITLPLFGSISLRGVLRSEIEEHLTRELGKVIRDPVVRAEGLMRLSIQGAVAGPGFYLVPTDMLLSEALMSAGGPAGDADLDKLRIERAGRPVLSPEETQTALVEGRTLDQLNLQAGDQIILPRSGKSVWWEVGRYVGLIATTFVLGVRIF